MNNFIWWMVVADWGRARSIGHPATLNWEKVGDGPERAKMKTLPLGAEGTCLR